MKNTACLILVYALLLIGWQPVRAEEPNIMVVGDSLSTGYGIDANKGWVTLLQQRLRSNGFPHQVINASVSGDTSRGGLARLPAALERHQPAIVILELGGNDGLRGLSLKSLEDNLAAMIEFSRAAGAQVVLAEMRIPPNYGPVYTKKFQTLYTELAQRYAIPLIPFLLEGVAGNEGLMQNDGIHPVAEAQPRILDNVWPTLESLLNEMPNQQTAAANCSRLNAQSGLCFQ
ncbi:MAG: arylesterase [Candidatus Competibacteraceae bacterium]|jgi:acyl-CoA thioesterase-1|nr:arylesterase [Candidatus Competibacteraceae bacterium]